MILPMRVALLVDLVAWLGDRCGGLVVGGRWRISAATATRAGRRHAVAEPVAPLELVDDLALGTAGAGLSWPRPRARAGRTACPTTPRSGSRPRTRGAAQLAVDGGDALDPAGRPASVGGTGLDRAVEVVDERQHLAEQDLVGEAELRSRSSLGAALEVGEVGGARAARACRYSSDRLRGLARSPRSCSIWAAGPRGEVSSSAMRSSARVLRLIVLRLARVDSASAVSGVQVSTVRSSAR